MVVKSFKALSEVVEIVENCCKIKFFRGGMAERCGKVQFSRFAHGAG